MPETQTRVAKVLERMAASCAANNEYAEMYACALDSMLYELHGEDVFGSESQNDPRGDFRNGNWSILDRVEGVDV